MSRAGSAKRVNPWPFIASAYLVTLGATGGLALWAYLAMRRAERAAQAGRRR